MKTKIYPPLWEQMPIYTDTIDYYVDGLVSIGDKLSIR